MATYTPKIATGGSNGRNIRVGATTSPGTTLHTADATGLDEVYIYASNVHTAEVELTLELGGTTNPDDRVIKTILPKDGEVLVLNGRRFTGGVVIKAFASLADKIMLGVDVNRIT